MELPGCQHGAFINVWFQPELNCRRRFKKGAVPAPITVMVLSKRPDEEHLGFYCSGPPVPTAIVRTMLPPRETRASGITPGATLTVAKDGKDWYYLCRPDGKKLSRIRADAKVCLGHGPRGRRVPARLSVPRVQPGPDAPGQDEGPSYTMALKLMGA